MAMVAAACGGGTETTTTQATVGASTTEATGGASTTEAPPATEAPKVELTLKYADQNSETGWEGKNAAVPWLAQIEQATQGQIKVEPYFGQTLCKGADTWESLKVGIADFAWCMHGYWKDLTPLADVISLPFMPIKSAEQGSAVLWQLYEEFPSIQAEFGDNHPVLAWTSSPYYILTTNKPVRTVADMKGLKIRALGGPPTDVAKAMGASPITMPMPDTYQALQTGVLDGIFNNWEAIYSFRHYEVCKYLTMVPVHVAYFSQSFNNSVWDKLPEDVKAGVESVSGEVGSRFWGANMFDSAQQGVEAILKEQGFALELITLTDAELATWRDEFGKPMWEQWVKDMEAKGHTDARAILDRALELLETVK